MPHTSVLGLNLFAEVIERSGLPVVVEALRVAGFFPLPHSLLLYLLPDPSHLTSHLGPLPALALHLVFAPILTRYSETFARCNFWIVEKDVNGLLPHTRIVQRRVTGGVLLTSADASTQE